MGRQHGPEARHPMRRAAGRGALWLLRLAVVTAAAVAVAPMTAVAAGAAGYAWWRGWTPRRLYEAAAWCLPMAAAWLIAVAVWPEHAALVTGPGFRLPPPGVGPGSPWFRVVVAPYRAWTGMWQLAGHGQAAGAVVAVAPLAVPLGIAVGGLAWTYRLFRMRSGAGGLTPAAPAAFDQRQWRHQVRSARALIAAPGSLPLLIAGGQVAVGATIRSVRHRAGAAAVIPYERLRSHQVVIGSTGTGKTTLLLRLWAGFMAAGLRRHAAGTGRPPLLVVLDCKGGASSRKIADRTRRVLRDAGARSTAIWPDETPLSLWTLPADRLVTTLLDLIEHGTGGAAYYSDVMEALVSLAVCAPCGPPVSSADFLGRLDADWLAMVYGANGDGAGVATARSSAKAFNDVRLRFAALWRRLGGGLDGCATYADADAWYCVLEGTAEIAVAEAQARALTDLLAFYALDGEREILLCVDEFSAVSRRLPIWQLYERARSLGLAVQVSAQSWEGLADSQDERNRVAATAEGGIWLLRTPRPDPVVELAGTQPSVDTTRRFDGAGAWSDDGLSRARLAPVLDGDLVRRLEVGQVAYVYRGGVTFLQIKRLTGRQAALGPGSASIIAAGVGDRAERGAGWSAGAGAPGEPPTIPLPVIGATPGAGFAWTGRGPVFGNASGPPWERVPGAASGAPGSRPPGSRPGMAAAEALASGVPALPDVGEVLDDAFGARRE
ncbi:MAG TPA: hypothetical protein VII59_21285 [Streptosporangiaceae bacterium]